MNTVHFSEVGRNSRSWTATTQDVTRKWLIDQVRKNAQVMSRGLDFEEDDSIGYITAGWRIIGTYRVEGGKTL